ncbi:MAG: helix-turn-helix transcriptional regulator [Rhodospirillaceae bacterium]|nr:helix-turn-helix transcriptional regulator [Rhodospirillaceae bacterium]
MTKKNKTGVGAKEVGFEEFIGQDETLSGLFESASYAMEGAALVRSFRVRAGEEEGLGRSITQNELADRMKVTQARISTAERGGGRDGPSYSFLKRAAKACNVDWPDGFYAKKPTAPRKAAVQVVSFENVFGNVTVKPVNLRCDPAELNISVIDGSADRKFSDVYPVPLRAFVGAEKEFVNALPSGKQWRQVRITDPDQQVFVLVKCAGKPARKGASDKSGKSTAAKSAAVKRSLTRTAHRSRTRSALKEA